MFFASTLQRAIRRGMAKDGRLSEELDKLDSYVIRTKQDALAICNALDRLISKTPRTDAEFWLSVQSLTRLFQNVDPESSPALGVLFRHGVSLLAGLVNQELRNTRDESSDILLFILKILAMYGTHEAAECLVAAANLPLKPDSYMWSVIFSQLYDGHPERDYIFQCLSESLTSGFISVALLDAANMAAIEGKLDRHPFDSPRGHELLQGWIEDRNPDNFSYAHSATAALPFVQNPIRDQLLALAMEHANVNVQIESAWAGAKVGREAALKVLARFALDVNHSQIAQRYLKELGCEAAIPLEATEPTFLARATFASWLAHPNELAVPPDEVTVVDHRMLNWPTENVAKPFWLLAYKLNDKTGLEDDSVGRGLVGSMTWCFFSNEMHQRPPEDCYAIHCYWEMKNEGLITEADDVDAAEYASLLQHWTGEPLESPTMKVVAELSPKLSQANRLVAIAEAKLNAEPGWVVLDGQHSRWYPKYDQPPKTAAGYVLSIHVGSQLLGFENEPDRRRFLIKEKQRKSPEQITAAYQRVLKELEGGRLSPKRELEDACSLIARHFDAYVDSLVLLNKKPKSKNLIDVYEHCLNLAENAESTISKEMFSISGVISDHFTSYVEAIISNGRASDVVPLIEKLAPYWNHNRGSLLFGTAAFRAGNDEVAESYFVKLRESPGGVCFSEEMSFLAEIWHRHAKIQAAKDLLVECMRHLLKLIKESKYQSSRESYSGDYRLHRETYIRLFPDGLLELKQQKIPDDPM